ncbi:hypothetical protein DQ181_12845 [Enterococcus faecium]|nr:hypothetical protein [Enterococcus faecium]
MNLKNEIKQRNEESTQIWKRHFKSRILLKFLLTMDKLWNPFVVTSEFAWFKATGFLDNIIFKITH